MQRLFFVTSLVLSSCADTSPLTSDGPRAGELAAGEEQIELVAADGAELVKSWRPEQLTLPTGWGPDLPAGKEDVRFAPGMFVAGAEDYWSYVFRIDFDQELTGEAAVQDFLEQYYDGLLGHIGKLKNLGIGDDPAQVQIESASEHKLQAKVDLIDAFVTGEPLVLFLDWQANGKTVHVTASPQPRSHEIWQSLRAIAEVL